MRSDGTFTAPNNPLIADLGVKVRQGAFVSATYLNQLDRAYFSFQNVLGNFIIVFDFRSNKVVGRFDNLEFVATSFLAL